MDKTSFWGGVFTDVDGGFSFKRVQTGIFTMLFSMITICKMNVSDNIFQLLCGLMAYGYTGIVAEKFTSRGKDVSLIQNQ